MGITVYNIIGVVIAVALIEAVGIYFARKVKSAKDFAEGGGRAGAWMVCGTICGAIIGGQSTIGTSQMAFSYGLSAMWFTVGCALGCVLLVLVYSRGLRESGCTTMLEVVSRQYGKKTEITGSLLCSIGIFISIIAQVLASGALLMSLFPLDFTTSAVIAMLIMTVFVMFGGLASAGPGGVVKMVLLSLSAIAAGVIVYRVGHGVDGVLGGISGLLPGTALGEIAHVATEQQMHDTYLSVLARGPLKDIGSCVSVILGVASTQTYALAVLSARTTRAAKRGGLLAAVFVLPIALACTFVGMYMRAHYITADEMAALQAAGEAVPAGVGVIQSSAMAFPMFVVDHVPGVLGGLMLGTMLITMIISGAGLALGGTTIMVRDVFMHINPSLGSPARNLHAQRITLVSMMVLAVVASILSRGSFINDLGFLSMGLRAVVVLLPLTFALYCPGRFAPRWIFLSVIAGTAALFAAKLLLPAAVDPTLIGLGACLAVCLCGWHPAASTPRAPRAGRVRK